jgi:uncharacterized protein with von Willebrand factor type A (vWA) domain
MATTNETTNTLPGGAPADAATGSDLVYAVDGYTRDAARFHALRERSTQAVLRDGRARFAGWESFHREMFARCVGDPERLATPRAGAEWADKLHRLADDVTELRDLRAQTRGNEWWANLAASAIERTLIEKTKAPAGGPVPDGSDDAEVAEALRALLDEPGLPEAERAALDEAATAAQERADKAARAAKAAAQKLDPTDVREALRAGVAAAKTEIADAQRAADGFAFGQGSDPHAGGRAGHRAAQKLAEVVRSNDRLRRIAEFAGRLRRIADRQQSAKPRAGTDELCGIEQGDDLARLLPSELVYAADPTLEAVFGRRFAEGSLDLYELKRTPPKQQGPVVFCLDSSGSMKWNDHDAWAAAVALAFLHIAQTQGRAFALVHFGSSTLRVDRFPAKVAATPEAAMDAVGFFASAGGTDFEAPLDSALGIIHDEGDLRDADIIFCTDGQASVEDGWLAQYRAERARLGIRVQGICIGPESAATTLKNLSDEVVYLADALREEGAMHGVFGRV